MFLSYEKVSRVCDKPYGLSDSEYRIASDKGVTYYDGRAYQTYYPESCRQYRFVMSSRVKPLINESKSEDYLSGRSEQKKPKRNFVVLYEF